MSPALMDDPRFCSYLLTCAWMLDEFRKVYPENKCGLWSAGIDLDLWPDSSHQRKPIDVLIYDKVRWDRETTGSALMSAITGTLATLGVTSAYLRYGKYDYKTYKRALASSRSMVFLCEHETQGMAYQEALASGVPVIAWDPGTWRRSQRKEAQRTYPHDIGAVLRLTLRCHVQDG